MWTIKNMTISEFKERVAKDGMLLIEVENHKTMAAFGPANIVIEGCFINLMKKYYKNTRKNEEFKNRFFITHSGNEFRKIFVSVKRFD